MEMVAFPDESDIAAQTQTRSNGPTLSNCTRSSSAKPSLVQVVPLCQIALDPHLCLIGNDGNGGISKRE